MAPFGYNPIGSWSENLGAPQGQGVVCSSPVSRPAGHHPEIAKPSPCGGAQGEPNQGQPRPVAVDLVCVGGQVRATRVSVAALTEPGSVWT